MKLELKHLAPYLPYGLKVELLNFPFGGKHVRTLELDCGHDFNYYLNEGLVRPYLRSIDEINERIFESGEEFVPFKKLQLSMLGTPMFYKGVSVAENRLVTNTLSYTDWNLLVSWKFDVFGLIEKGLANNINDL